MSNGKLSFKLWYVILSLATAMRPTSAGHVREQQKWAEQAGTGRNTGVRGAGPARIMITSKRTPLKSLTKVVRPCWLCRTPLFINAQTCGVCSVLQDPKFDGYRQTARAFIKIRDTLKLTGDFSLIERIAEGKVNGNIIEYFTIVLGFTTRI